MSTIFFLLICVCSTAINSGCWLWLPANNTIYNEIYKKKWRGNLFVSQWNVLRTEEMKKKSINVMYIFHHDVICKADVKKIKFFNENKKRNMPPEPEWKLFLFLFSECYLHCACVTRFAGEIQFKLFANAWMKHKGHSAIAPRWVSNKLLIHYVCLS